jgi:predicted ATPase
MLLRSISLQPDRYPDREQYPFNLAVFQDTEPLPLRKPITVFVGENGSGKSTLLRAIADSARIHIWDSRTLGRQRIRHSPWERALHRYVDFDWDETPGGAFFGADAFGEFTRMLDNWASTDPGLLAYFGGSSLMTRSHGEGHLAWFDSQLQRPGLFLLDEPESALSPRHQVEFVKIMLAATRRGAQFVAATHSPIIMAAPDAQILLFGPERIRPVPFEQTEHFQVYREFLRDPDAMFSE